VLSAEALPSHRRDTALIETRCIIRSVWDGEAGVWVAAMKPSEALYLHRAAISHELLTFLGVPVDVVTPRALPVKLRQAILAEAQPV